MLQPSEEIKSKLDIVEVIRDYIQLKPAGINFRGVCPFHQEKTPSFMVSPEKQIWHCFGCGKGGDIFSFVMEMEGINFVEALRLLAPKAGVTLKKQDPKLTSERNRSLDILELASRYYYKVLIENNNASNAKKYLVERGLTDETIENWQIGYSPDSWDDLIIFLKSKGYNDNEIFSSGMSIKKEGTGRFYNRFRGRIMFPINDVNGNTVAFSARVSPEKEAEEKMGKYINSPQTSIYNKSNILFGLDRAKMEIKKQDLAIIVEGQMDVITAHQHGFFNVIASSGTALTENHISLIKRYSNNIALAFDMDKAGELAAERGIAQAMQAEMNIKVIELPSGKDPDECIKNSPDEWNKAVVKAKSVMQYYFDKTLVDLDLEQVEDKQKAVKTLLPVIAKLGSKIEQDFWFKKLSQTVDVGEHFLIEALNKAKANKPDARFKNNNKNQENINNKIEYGREEILSELLLALMLKFPLHIDYIINSINIDYIIGIINKGIYRNLIIYYNKITDIETRQTEDGELKIDYQEFQDYLAQNINNDKENMAQLVNRLMFLADKDFYDYDLEEAKQEIIKILSTLKKNYLSERLKEIAKLIARSESDNDEEKLKNLMEEFKILVDEIRTI